MAQNIKVALGSVTDCEKLIGNVVKSSKTPTFADFAVEWKKLHFNLIYCGREPKIEEPVFVKELFGIAKSYVLGSQSLNRKIAGFYLLYSLYYKQKTNIKIRLTLSELKNILETLDEIRSEGNREAEYMFHKLFVNNAFHFCATPSEHVFASTQKFEEGDGESLGEPRSDLVEMLSGDLLDQLEIIHSRYEDMKLAISDPNSQDTSLKTIKSDYISQIQTQLASLKANIERSRGTKHKAGRDEAAANDSSSDFDESEEDEDEDIGSRRQRIKAKSFQTSTDTYRLPGASRTTVSKRGRKKLKNPSSK